MRIVFIGCVEFSRAALECLLGAGAEISGVCTLKKSDFNADFFDLGVICEAYGIPYIYPDDINSPDTLHWIRDKSPDVIFCFGWSRLLKQALLDIPPMGIVGFHPAALPANRGRHPLIWALVLGLEKTASTFFFMDAGADSGDILSQREILIDQDDDAHALYNKVTQCALEQIKDFIPLLSSGKIQRRKQDLLSGNTWRKRGVSDGEIDWRMSAKSIHNLVRGLTKPYVGASFSVAGQTVKVWKTAVLCGTPQNIEPGKVLMPNGSKHVIKCGEDAICLLVTEPSVDLLVGSYL
jgi:methionyl-tRNA formyltransferase